MCRKWKYKYSIRYLRVRAAAAILPFIYIQIGSSTYDIFITNLYVATSINLLKLLLLKLFILYLRFLGTVRFNLFEINLIKAYINDCNPIRFSKISKKVSQRSRPNIKFGT